MTRNLKSAFFSALLVWAVAYPVLGLKLTIVGINIEVHNTSTLTLSVSPILRSSEVATSCSTLTSGGPL